ncbi:class I SAM-dependent methyltransferase [Aminipila butyrica]|uniref:Class I SAM-dependent methyltransferase n=1 Tax=Aminipila butyrica TaxID=433296 RepID=A0A858BYW4_9FIRM|nr:class I SAM-dependent methyltransferase [Aminipila butyrica]QIB70325.1 class I SAM-dependent methyltransferase [Aminipila butyrica]
MTNHKLDNPKRIDELNPANTLRRIGLKAGDSFGDIGAGTGIFSFEAAERTKANVYAVEISPEMLAILQNKKHERNTENIILKKDIREIPSACCQRVLLCTVLHELSEPEDMLDEIKRILTSDGIVAIIEFHKKQTPMGPPIEHRISSEQVEEEFLQHGFSKMDYFELGENFYLLLFSKTKNA